jgi:hypothetical protein
MNAEILPDVKFANYAAVKGKLEELRFAYKAFGMPAPSCREIRAAIIEYRIAIFMSEKIGFPGEMRQVQAPWGRVAVTAGIRQRSLSPRAIRRFAARSDRVVPRPVLHWAVSLTCQRSMAIIVPGCAPIELTARLRAPRRRDGLRTVRRYRPTVCG